MTTERTLKRWRKDALSENQLIHSTEVLSKNSGEVLNADVLRRKELNERILRLTQELLDQHLLRER